MWVFTNNRSDACDWKKSIEVRILVDVFGTLKDSDPNKSIGTCRRYYMYEP